MATDNSADIIQLHQPSRPKTPAERAKAYRDRKRASHAVVEVKAKHPATVEIIAPVRPASPVKPLPVTPVTRRHAVTLPSLVLTMTAFGLAAVGVTMNGWYARSLGSSDVAGWLFLAIGVAADLAALAIPACAASQWQARRRGAAAAGWLVWCATFGFAVMAGIGFAAINISDVTASRASRVTPAVTAAQSALADAVTARDRECKGGVGKFCRDREATVIAQRQVLDGAMRAVEAAADPQTEAASKIVSWLTGGVAKPSGDDVAMLRLILLALLPQVGGILLMIGRSS